MPLRASWRWCSPASPWATVSASLGFEGRIQEREVWRVVDTLLEAFVFAYIGLQLRFVVEDAAHGGFGTVDLLRTAGLVLLTVIVVRVAWIFATAPLARLRNRAWIRGGSPKLRGWPMPPPLSWRENVALSWAGMRGVVTLAAAVGTPFVGGDGAPFTAREAIIPIAFAVAIGTLLLQGLTLPLLIRVLNIHDDETPADHKHQLTLARQAIRKVSLEELQKLAQRRDAGGNPDRRAAGGAGPADGYRRGRDGKRGARTPRGQRALEASKRVLAAQRRVLIAERDAGRLDDEVMRELLEDIDLEEAVVSSRRDRLS